MVFHTSILSERGIFCCCCIGIGCGTQCLAVAVGSGPNCTKCPGA